MSFNVDEQPLNFDEDPFDILWNHLNEQKKATQIDSLLVRAVADHWLTYREAMKRAKEVGYLLDTGNTLKTHPFTVLAASSRRAFQDGLQELGLTPKTRHKTERVKDDRDELAEILDR